MESPCGSFVTTSRQEAPLEEERLGEKQAGQAGASVARQYQSVANELRAGASF